MYAEDEVLYTYKVLRDVTFAVFVGNLSSMKSQCIWSRPAGLITLKSSLKIKPH